MLTKKFEGQASTTNGVIAADDDEAALSRFSEILSALVYFDSGQKDAPAITSVIDRIVGVVPPEETGLNTAWHFQRRDLLAKKVEALVNFDESMNLFRAHAEATYLKPGISKCEAKHGISTRVMLNHNCETVKDAARKSVAEARRTGAITEERAQLFNERLDENTQAAATYVGVDTPAEYTRVSQHIALTYPVAMASVLRFVELDLAYIAANVNHFDRMHRVKLTSYVQEMRNLVGTQSVANLKAMGEEKPVFRNGAAPAPAKRSKAPRADLH